MTCCSPATCSRVGVRAAIARRRLYDTRGPGRSNAGHPFGWELDAEVRAAVLAFLTSLAPHQDLVRVAPAPEASP